MSITDSSPPANIPYSSWTALWKKNTKKLPEPLEEFYHEPFETLFRIQRGLAGHVSFLATCDTNIVFTEYLLYEPILRILRQRDYTVECEVPWSGHVPGTAGDPMRIDFVAHKNGLKTALEVKWLRWDDDDDRDYLDIQRDTEKLIAELNPQQGTRCFLCVFGRCSQIVKFNGGKAKIQIEKYDEALPPVYADFRRTIFGSRIFELKPGQSV
jgi:hypothetical protein